MSKTHHNSANNLNGGRRIKYINCSDRKVTREDDAKTKTSAEKRFVKTTSGRIDTVACNTNSDEASS